MSQSTTTTWFGTGPDSDPHPEVAARCLALRRTVARHLLATHGSQLLDPFVTQRAVEESFQMLVSVVAMTKDTSPVARSARRVQAVKDLDKQYRSLGTDPKLASSCAQRIYELGRRYEQEWNALLGMIEAIPGLAWAA